jgi:hypothetical protein
MVGITTINPAEPIAKPVSSVPFTADVAELRSIGGAFPLQPNPTLFALSAEQLHRIGVEPMGQPPVQHPGKRSPLVAFSVLQAFDAKRFNAEKIYSFKLAPNERFDFGVGVLLPFNK